MHLRNIVDRIIAKKRKAVNLGTVYYEETIRADWNGRIQINYNEPVTKGMEVRLLRVDYMETSRSLREISKQTVQYLWLHEHMEMDRFVTPEGEYIVQGRVKHARIRRWFGLDKRVQIKWKQEDGSCFFSVGSAAIMDKIWVIGVSFFGLWPLLFVALFGLADQLLLLRRLRGMIRLFQ